MRLVVPKETARGERRVALNPDAAAKLRASGWTVVIESGAGEQASFFDDHYRQGGVEVASTLSSALSGANLVVCVTAPDEALCEALPEGVSTLSFFSPSQHPSELSALSKKRATVYSFDLLPRISRAQSMDALSSQATVSGYRAALSGATHLGRFFPMFMTAAGTIPPAKVLVMGVGVAGLQAIATARRLGAVVRAYDVRAAAKEEAESLGATFVDLGIAAEGVGGYARELSADELAEQQAALAAEVAKADVVITTAAVPGRKAPILVTTAMVEQMSPGAILIDMAADSGGNCEATVPGEEVDVSGTLVVGLSNPPAQMPTHASTLYAKNVVNLVNLLAPNGLLAPDPDDEIVAGTCLLRNGEAVHNAARAALDAREKGTS